MATSSRRLSQRAKGNKASHTPGRDKGPSCKKSDLKSWGATANPYKLKGAALHKYRDYSDHVYSINGQRPPYNN